MISIKNQHKKKLFPKITILELRILLLQSPITKKIHVLNPRLLL